ncbi:MAG: hypothetical protein NC903_01995, partial [Candidatus Omnitrophica bacterium]|nr:hypothetical protein [Candidatus Omnitrophota bacterium]
YLVSKIKEFRKNPKRSILPEISVKKPKIIKGGSGKIAILDLGITNGILNQLKKLGFSLVILPFDTKPQEILKLKPQGLIISSGPEEDIGLEKVIENLKSLLGKIPLMGISTGCQVLARASGAKLLRMKLGHHGLNYPIKRIDSLKGEITTQNHSYTIDKDSLDKDIKITAFNLNDNTAEEIESKKYKFIGVQYLPLSPGFEETHPVFERFVKEIERS